jgi:poly(beta-D-mannuronate) lyase
MKKILLSTFLFLALWSWTMPSVRAGEIDRSTIKVTASTWEQKAKGGWGDMPPERSLDGDLKTAWMAEGDGVWIQYDFGAVQALKTVELAFSSGDKRVYTFDILVSQTGEDNSWTTVADKAKNSGTTLQMEPFAFPTTQARYVRIVGHGNTSEKFAKWCNVTEAAFVTE